MNQAETAIRSINNRAAIFTLAIAMVLASLGTSIANVGLPVISLDLAAPLWAVQWVVTTYLVALTVASVAVGFLGDTFGLRKMLLWGLALFTLASLFCGLASSLPALIAARFLQGIAAAFLITLSIALVRETAGPKKIGQTMGLLGSMSACGIALGPSLGGFLVETMNWNGMFLILVPGGIVGFVMAWFFTGEDDGGKNLSKLTQSVFDYYALMPKLAANLLVSSVMMATLVVGPFYLGMGLGLETSTVGIVMSVGPVIAIFCGVPSGRLVDIFGPGKIVVAGLCGMAAGAFGLCVLPVWFGVKGYLAAIAVLTPSYQLFLAANNSAVMLEADERQRGVFSGLLNLSRNLGLVLGALLLGGIFSFGVGTSSLESAVPAQLADGLQLTFAIASGMMALAICLVCLRPRRVR